MSPTSPFIILALVSTLTFTIRADNTRLVNEGIKAGNEIIRLLQQQTDYEDLYKVSDQFTPFFDGLAGVISDRKIWNDYLKLEQDFSSLEKTYKTTKDLFNTTSLRDNYLPSMEIIDIYLSRLTDALKDPTRKQKNSLNGPYEEFANSYKVYFDESTDQILKGINSTIPKAIMCETKNDRQLTMNHIKGMILLLLKGVRVTLAYHKIDDSNNFVEKSKLWVESLKNVIDDTKRMEGTVKSNWITQAELEIKLRFAKSNNTAKAIASDAYAFLSKKYYWRDWFVAVFSPLEFITQYYGKYCDAFSFIKDKGERKLWNVLVASVDKTKPSTNVQTILNRVESKNKDCNTRYNHLNFGFHEETIFPRFIFEEQMPDNLNGQCNIVNVLGIMKHDVKVLEIKATTGRLFRVDGKCIKLFAFG